MSSSCAEIPKSTARAITAPSLLTGRWHASSRVVAVLVLLFLVFSNLPGQLVQSGDYDSLIEDRFNSDRFEHGWPMTWMTRRYRYLHVEDTLLSGCFNLASEPIEFRPVAAVVNAAAVLLLSLAAGYLFEPWRRQRSRLWQLHLRDIALLVTLACVVAGWYAAKRHAKALEVAALARSEVESRSDAERDPRLYLDASRLREGGITWLRRLVGEAPFEPFDRTMDLTVNRAGLPLATPCTEVVSLKVLGPLSREDLTLLDRFRQLQELELLGGISSEPEGSVELPRLAQLRALYVGTSDPFLTGFDRLPRLEWIDVGTAPLNRSMLREMALLRELRTLRLVIHSLEPGCLEELAGLKSLESLFVKSWMLSGKDMHDITQLAILKRLDFGEDTVPQGSLRHLQGLRQLETLDLSYNDVSDDDVRHLAALPQLAFLNLEETPITAAAIPHLSRMKQLRFLMLPKLVFSAEELAALNQALPDCEVISAVPR